MADLASVWIPGFLCLASFVSVVTGGEYCFSYDFYYRSARYCRFGCCGWNDSECCDIDSGIIVGICIGSIVLLAVIITVICCCMKKQGYRGRVVGPRTAARVNVTVVQATTQSGYAANPGYGPPPPPPPYYPAPPNPNTNATTYSYSGAAYPPGPPQGFAAPAAPAYAPPQGPKGF